jgi:CelD/BcsL family acetyltransferase involved in cellulose biosynthesis
MTVRVFTAKNELGELSGPWDRLFAEANHPLPYLARPWVLGHIEQNCNHPGGCLPGCKCMLITVWQGQRLAAILPLAWRKSWSRGLVRPIGTGIASYLGILAHPACPAAIDELAEYLADHSLLDVLIDEDLSSRDSESTRFFAALAHNGFEVYRVKRNPCHVVELEPSFEQYLKKRMDRSHRGNLRRLQRKLLSKGNVSFACYDHDLPREILARAAKVQLSRWHKTPWAAVLQQPFYQNLFTRMVNAGLAQVYLVSHGEKDIAFGLGVRNQQQLYMMYIGYDMDYADDSAGIVLISWILEDACRKGFHLLDFGHGHAEYKRRFSSFTYDVERIVAGKGLFGAYLAQSYYRYWKLGANPRLRKLYRSFRDKIRQARYERTTLAETDERIGPGDRKN